MAHIPKNIDKILFAEDLVSYVMLSYDTSFELTVTAESFRNVVYNAFNETVRDAIDFLTCQFHQKNCLKFDILKGVEMATESNYWHLVDDLHATYFAKGFEARKFLYFCAHLSSMAGIYYSFGIKTAPNVAVQAIKRSLEDYPMQFGAWDTVNNLAAEYSNMAVNCDYSKCPVDCLHIDYYQTFSPGSSPRSSTDEYPEDDPYDDFESEVLDIVSVQNFLDVDVERMNCMVSLAVGRAIQSYKAEERENSDHEF